MVINLIHCPLRYEIEKLSMAFFPEEKFQIHEEAPYAETDVNGVITVCRTEEAGSQKIQIQAERNGVTVQQEEVGSFTESTEILAGRVLYRALSELTGITPPWGILTGVRPSKLMTAYMAQSGAEAAKEHFRKDLLVSPEKAELVCQVSEAEERILATSTPNSYSLYVSIPFCPNRCSYCSFVSHSISSPGAKKLLPVYVDLLLKELQQTAELVRNSNLHLESVYIGGGTPSTLSAEQITALLGTIQSEFDLSQTREFTFESGRPDTMNLAKWQAIRQGGVTRVSINPQTMTDSILQSIGRDHTVQDIEDCFREARSVGFQDINMDLIAGLEGDTPENFERSLNAVLALDPESVTVHTLAYKRSSNLVPTEELFSRGKDTAKMLHTAEKQLRSAGHLPYYLYRQTRSVGNLENVGWCKPGHECYYNIYMMEECHSILSCGAGAVTKLKVPDTNAISRLFHFKYPYEYNTRFEKLQEQKEELSRFLLQYHHK